MSEGYVGDDLAGIFSGLFVENGPGSFATGDTNANGIIDDNDAGSFAGLLCGLGTAGNSLATAILYP